VSYDPGSLPGRRGNAHNSKRERVSHRLASIARSGWL
jgi:hypothetical protein